MTNEPTTGEIVRELKHLEDACYKTYVPRVMMTAHMLRTTINCIAALTARAEQAEQERDFFIDKIRGRCSECKNEHLHSYVEPCATCHNANGYPKWEWRGLQPQDGGENETDYA